MSRAEIKAFYDRFGSKQDSQGFYEDVATGVLLEQGEFNVAQGLCEFGVGTGRLAEKLLGKYLPATCRYWGTDISSTMVELATTRLRRWTDRARVVISDGAMKLPVPDGAYDRFLCAYVLDLLVKEEASALVVEARRVLAPGGLLCVVSLTHGKTLMTRAVSSIWKTIHSLKPMLVGGCRPVELLDFIPEEHWKREFHTKVSAFGISSQILVAQRLP